MKLSTKKRVYIKSIYTTNPNTCQQEFKSDDITKRIHQEKTAFFFTAMNEEHYKKRISLQATMYIAKINKFENCFLFFKEKKKRQKNGYLICNLVARNFHLMFLLLIGPLEFYFQIS